MENHISFKDKLESCYAKREINAMHIFFAEIFANYFTSQSYIHELPASLISQEDKSVKFTCSSTNKLKHLLFFEDFQGNGSFVTQECLRTHALRYAFDNNWLPFGQAYFNISGLMSRPDRFYEVLGEVIEFTTMCLGINRSDLLIKSSQNMDILDSIDKHTDIKVEYNTEDENYYRWVFGIPKVYGEGLTISLKQGNDTYLDVGNIIRILGDRESEQAIEFGYGHEFFMSKVVGVENPLELSKVFEIFPFKADLSSKYFGNLEVLCRIKKGKEGIKVSRGVRRIYNTYLKSLLHMANALDKSPQDVLFDISQYYVWISKGIEDLTLEEKILLKNK